MASVVVFRNCKSPSIFLPSIRAKTAGEAFASAKPCQFEFDTAAAEHIDGVLVIDSVIEIVTKLNLQHVSFNHDLEWRYVDLPNKIRHTLQYLRPIGDDDSFPSLCVVGRIDTRSG